MLPLAVWQRLGRDGDTALRVIFLIIALISSVIAADTQTPTPAPIPQTADILAFDLSPVSGSNESGLLTISLGQNEVQKVDVLVSPYTNSGVMMEVPVAMSCTNAPSGDWNVIYEPSPGAVVLVGNNNTDGGLGGDEILGEEGTKMVRWKATSQTSNGEVLKLTLRKGKGEKVQNVTVIEEHIPNNGEYPWNVSKTYHDNNLINDDDYSLMLWSDNPLQRSVSGYFTIGDAANSTEIIMEAKIKAAEETSCLSYLQSHGGYYDAQKDPDYAPEKYYMEFVSNDHTNWYIHNDGEGATTLSLEGRDISGAKQTPQFKNTSMQLMIESSLGRGMFSLSALQAARNAEVEQMNIVALNLGTPNHPGSVVLGGYDDSLIDKSQRAVFPKSNNFENAFHAPMTAMSVIDMHTGAEIPILDKNGLNSASAGDVGLAYDDFGVRLSKEVINTLLPVLGNPKFDEAVNGYIYSGTPKTDYALTFTLHNGSAAVTIRVPASSLLYTESSTDNPLTPHNESGRTYLRISPTPDGSRNGQFLGRSFLQHVYMISSPSSMGSFHISALSSPLPTEKRLIPASPSSIGIFSGTFPSGDGSPRIGPMVGGIVGGLFILAAGAIGCWFYTRKRDVQEMRDRSSQSAMGTYPDYNKEAGLGHVVNHARSSSVQTGGTIPIRYSPSFDKELGVVKSVPVEGLVEPDDDEDEDGVYGGYQGYQGDYAGYQFPRRHSEVSTVLREYTPPERKQQDNMATTDVVEEAIVVPAALYRSATVGRFVPAGRVKSLPPSSHTRTASVGRIILPGEIGSVHVSRSISTRGSGSPKTHSPASSGSGSLDDLREEGEGGTKTVRSSFALPRGFRNGDTPPMTPVNSGLAPRPKTGRTESLCTDTSSPDSPVIPVAISVHSTLGGAQETENEVQNGEVNGVDHGVVEHKNSDEGLATRLDLDSSNSHTPTPPSRSGSSDEEGEIFGLSSVARAGGGKYMDQEGWLMSGSEPSAGSGDEKR
ncbi:hypothetical protein BZA77DRAFT_322278 [Pyronema omphalodes]|nr:hypothetical protein BZA77DRAFT_322278 [Pyronema omphalodes]